MIQSLTKPQEGETAAESIQIALAVVRVYPLDPRRPPPRIRGVGGSQGPLQQRGLGNDEVPHIRPGVDLERRVPRPRPI